MLGDIQKERLELLRNKFGTSPKYIITLLCKSMMDLPQILIPFLKTENKNVCHRFHWRKDEVTENFNLERNDLKEI